MYQKNKIKKIPRIIEPLKNGNQGFIESLENQNRIELSDLLERQNKLLTNKFFIQKLPDKGEKIIKFRDKIIKEISVRDEVDKTASLISCLNIASKGKDVMGNFEWFQKYDEKSMNIIALNSDEETNPLKILPQLTGTNSHNKKLKNSGQENFLTNNDDLHEMQSLENDDLLNVKYIKCILNKVETTNTIENNDKKTFKPYKAIRDSDKASNKNKNSKNWEITAATSPPNLYGAIKTLSLNESLKLQKEQIQKLYEIRLKHATERLSQNIGKYISEDTISSFMKFRTADSENFYDADSDNEKTIEEDDKTKNSCLY